MSSYTTASQGRKNAIACARGSYQREVASGAAALSGADLRGKASRYAGRYAASREALLFRIGEDDAFEVVARHGRRVLVYGSAATRVAWVLARVELPGAVSRAYGELALRVEQLSREGRDDEAEQASLLISAAIRMQLAPTGDFFAAPCGYAVCA